MQSQKSLPTAKALLSSKELLAELKLVKRAKLSFINFEAYNKLFNLELEAPEKDRDTFLALHIKLFLPCEDTTPLRGEYPPIALSLRYGLAIEWPGVPAYMDEPLLCFEFNSKSFRGKGDKDPITTLWEESLSWLGKTHKAHLTTLLKLF